MIGTWHGAEMPTGHPLDGLLAASGWWGKQFVDGETVLEYTKPQIGGGNVSNYDPALKKDGQLLKEGYIALQSESHPVEFRKVEIFDLQRYKADPQKLKSVLNDLRQRTSN